MSTKTSSDEQEASVVNPDPKAAFDVVAHRKALEAALYEMMETPLEMLVRCKYQLSLDAECCIKDDGSADVARKIAFLDYNGFEMIRHMSSSDTHEELAAEETLSLQKDVDAEKTVLCLHPSAEAPRCGRVSLGQLFAAAADKEKMVITSPQKAMASTVSYDPHWTDPAVVGYKIKQQTPGKARVFINNSTQVSKQSGESAKNRDNRSNQTSVSTLYFSPPRTQRSHSSSPSGSSASSWTPPTPSLLPYAPAYWSHYPQPKPCHIMDWERFQWAMNY